jgi:hypothetical protein
MTRLATDVLNEAGSRSELGNGDRKQGVVIFALFLYLCALSNPLSLLRLGPPPGPRLGACSASRAFIIGARLRPALDTCRIAGAVKGGEIKAVSTDFSFFFSFSSFSSSSFSSSDELLMEDVRIGASTAVRAAPALLEGVFRAILIEE